MANWQCWEGWCVVGGGTDGGGAVKKKEEEGWQRRKKSRKKNWFFTYFGLWFLNTKSMESTPIYRWWKRNTLSLLETILAIDSNRKNLNCWFKGVIMVCQNRLLKLVMLATLGWRRSGYKDSWPARSTIGCSTISSHHGGVWFARFSVGGRIIKYPREIATWTTF
jgi:hypothetical protein